MSVAPDGSCAIQWMTTSTGDDDMQYLQAMQYNAAGVVQEDSPLSVASWCYDDVLVTQATLTVDGAGGFVSAWMESDYDSESGLSDLVARHYDASGTPSAS